MEQKISLTVDETASGSRLDAFISMENAEISRSHGVKLIDDGFVMLNGKPANKKSKVAAGDTVEITLPAPVELNVEAEEIALDIVYEDDSLLVINKPQGMVVHPAPGNQSGTLVNALMSHCKSGLSGINGVMRPGIVHRIDKDTSGLLIVAKSDAAHMFLSEQLKDRSLSRVYIALVNGNIKEDEGTIDLPIGRNATDRKKMDITNKNARDAVTHFTVLERFGRYTLAECRLQTGRTHQIRVHMAHIGHSVVGDKTYGAKKETFSLTGQLLHAARLKFIHPITKEHMECSTDIPGYFRSIVEKLRNGER